MCLARKHPRKHHVFHKIIHELFFVINTFNKPFFKFAEILKIYDNVKSNSVIFEGETIQMTSKMLVNHKKSSVPMHKHINLDILIVIYLNS